MGLEFRQFILLLLDDSILFFDQHTCSTWRWTVDPLPKILFHHQSEDHLSSFCLEGKREKWENSFFCWGLKRKFSNSNRTEVTLSVKIDVLLSFFSPCEWNSSWTMTNQKEKKRRKRKRKISERDEPEDEDGDDDDDDDERSLFIYPSVILVTKRSKGRKKGGQTRKERARGRERKMQGTIHYYLFLLLFSPLLSSLPCSCDRVTNRTTTAAQTWYSSRKNNQCRC